tara:strand:+ start:442 stop:567 length:126 start_codon:yes stop_codon:yes gene_type:complete
MSLSMKFAVDSLDVNVKAMFASLVVEPEETVEEVIVILGAV